MTNKLSSKLKSDILIYQTESGKTKIEVRLENETVWLTQKSMADLFQTTPQNITLHLKNVYSEGELEEVPTCKDFLQVQYDSFQTNTKHSKSTKQKNLCVLCV